MPTEADEDGPSIMSLLNPQLLSMVEQICAPANKRKATLQYERAKESMVLTTCNMLVTAHGKALGPMSMINGMMCFNGGLRVPQRDFFARAGITALTKLCALIPNQGCQKV